jgi:hypothetical protein
VGVAHAEVVIGIGAREVPLGTVGHDDRCHLGLVEDLALLQRAARRLGWSVRLCHASPELAELLDLAGLGDIIPTEDPPHGHGPSAQRPHTPRTPGSGR